MNDTIDSCKCACHESKPPMNTDGLAHDNACCDEMNGQLEWCEVKRLIADEVREAVKGEKSIRAKLITKAHKDGIADGLQMALYGVKNGSKEEKFIRHLLFSENIAELQSTQPSNKAEDK